MPDLSLLEPLAHGAPCAGRADASGPDLAAEGRAAGRGGPGRAAAAVGRALGRYRAGPPMDDEWTPAA